MVATMQQLDFDPAMQQARQLLFRFASLSLLDPRAGAWEQLHALHGDHLLRDAAELIRCDSTERPDDFGPGERPLEHLNPVDVLAELPATAEDLNRQYEATFGLLVSCACPPYETEYIHGKFAVQRAQTMADISGFYRAFGLQVAQGHPERHDHIVLELEFMAFLFGMEIQARQADDSRQDHAIVGREAQERFFGEHLAWWAFAHLLAREAGESFYGQAASLLAALITSERARYRLPVPNGALEPIPLERPEECDGCALAGS